MTSDKAVGFCRINFVIVWRLQVLLGSWQLCRYERVSKSAAVWDESPTSIPIIYLTLRTHAGRPSAILKPDQNKMYYTAP